MDLFRGLRYFLKTDRTIIDNCIFRLHYKATAIILIAFSILVTARQYFGDPIDCLPNNEDFSKILDTFCWIHSTFSLPKAWKKKIGTNGIPFPGVDKPEEGDKRVYHAYYQWVCFFLFLQAILFYVPRHFWKAMEGGRIKSLILGLNSPILPEETKTAKRKLLVEYIVSSMNNSSFYCMSYATAEIMNFGNVCGQILLTDTFLGGEFLTYGLEVIQFTGWGGSLRYDPMIKVFPILTKCTFHMYGYSGTTTTHDAFCILPVNIINEKIYVFLWFWFAVLTVLSAAALLYRASIVICPRFRLMITRSRARLANREYLETIINKCTLDDWFLLDLLSKNLDPLNFRDVINDFARQLDDKHDSF